MSITKTATTDPRLFVFELKNSSGASVKATNYGAILMSILVPDKNGNLGDVLLGYDTPERYAQDNPTFFGAVCGRYANRIRGGFTIHGKTYDLPKNEGDNQLHGGAEGFYTKVYDYEISGDTLIFSYTSPDGEMGYPGNLKMSVSYTFTDDNTLKLEYNAVCDQDTYVNLTNHAYFNLGGHDSGSMLNQKLQINAKYYTPVDAASIPLGNLAPVEGTPFDFTSPTPVGAHIEDDEEQLHLVGGYDQNFCLDGEGFRVFATLYDENSGRYMEASTDLPGVQFYSGNYIKTHTGKGGVEYTKRDGLCLETQYYPDSPNQPNFPDALLKAGEKYHTVTTYHFSVK